MISFFLILGIKNSSLCTVYLLEKHAAPHREQNVFSQKKRHTVYQHAFYIYKKAHVRLFTRHAPSF
ncbi:hypothetical protein BaLi_c11630 [Bacillus paralicheniformis ATCC 9945a]|nr:hypothetical protein BaLi_c11630 [Bacillus paralicheniformis ATCC 9945a]